MSQTVAYQALGPSRWTHMAVVMSKSLEQVIRAREARAGDIPAAALFAAKRFFGVVQDAVREVPENPAASVANYALAAEAIRAAGSSPAADWPEVDDRIRSLADLVNELSTPKKLNDDELRDADLLRAFFARLAHDGGVERYDKLMSESRDDGEELARLD